MFVNFCLSVKSTTLQIELNFNRNLTSCENGFSPCRVVGESWLRKLQPCFVPDLISALKLVFLHGSLFQSAVDYCVMVLPVYALIGDEW